MKKSFNKSFEKTLLDTNIPNLRLKIKDGKVKGSVRRLPKPLKPTKYVPPVSKKPVQKPRILSKRPVSKKPVPKPRILSKRPVPLPRPKPVSEKVKKVKKKLKSSLMKLLPIINLKLSVNSIKF